MTRLFVLIAALSILAGCTKLELLDVTIPRYGYVPKLDIVYGDQPRQTLDIYLPEGKSETPRPVIIFFYGGSWQRGSKEGYRFVGEAFAKRGYVTVVANYRLYPDVSFPTFVEDSAQAVHWVHDYIDHYGGDANNLYVAGHSAGAYNALMLAVAPEYLKAVGGSSAWMRGVIGLSGPYDFLPATQVNITEIFSTAPPNVTQPLQRVTEKTKNLPPVFLATGDADTVVMPKNTERMADKLKARGVAVETHHYPGVSHIGLGQALASSFDYIAPVADDVAAFIEKTHTH
jgi:acetyl esterase/lipase